MKYIKILVEVDWFTIRKLPYAKNYINRRISYTGSVNYRHNNIMGNIQAEIPLHVRHVVLYCNGQMPPIIPPTTTKLTVNGGNYGACIRSLANVTTLRLNDISLITLGLVTEPILPPFPLNRHFVSHMYTPKLNNITHIDFCISNYYFNIMLDSPINAPDLIYLSITFAEMQNIQIQIISAPKLRELSLTNILVNQDIVNKTLVNLPGLQVLKLIRCDCNKSISWPSGLKVETYE
jgi:hypothetical protein